MQGVYTSWCYLFILLERIGACLLWEESRVTRFGENVVLPVFKSVLSLSCVYATAFLRENHIVIRCPGMERNRLRHGLEICTQNNASHSHTCLFICCQVAAPAMERGQVSAVAPSCNFTCMQTWKESHVSWF